MKKHQLAFIVIMIVIAFSLFFIYYIFPNKTEISNLKSFNISMALEEKKLVEGCKMGKDDAYVICCYENGLVNDCRNRRNFRCGELIYVIVNHSKFERPEEYYLCARNQRLLLSTERPAPGIIDLYHYNRNTGIEFSCIGTVLNRSSTSRIFSLGRIPEMKGQIKIMEIYTFQTTKIYRNVNDFINDLNRAKIIFDLTGDIECI